MKLNLHLVVLREVDVFFPAAMSIACRNVLCITFFCDCNKLAAKVFSTITVNGPMTVGEVKESEVDFLTALSLQHPWADVSSASSLHAGDAG